MISEFVSRNSCEVLNSLHDADSESDRKDLNSISAHIYNSKKETSWHWCMHLCFIILCARSQNASVQVGWLVSCMWHIKPKIVPLAAISVQKVGEDESSNQGLKIIHQQELTVGIYKLERACVCVWQLQNLSKILMALSKVILYAVCKVPFQAFAETCECWILLVFMENLSSERGQLVGEDSGGWCR